MHPVMLYLQNPTVITVNGDDARTYSAPSASEVAVLVLGDEDSEHTGREVIVCLTQGPPGH